ncbi:MAG: HAMP domain-containing histidine kinase [Streptococcaceae bacterium]|jgi:two-component system sensor histidine kinase CiaH|nr:HAMP domain-containing histidine kinase [Streptococcaceae bacterium]
MKNFLIQKKNSLIKTVKEGGRNILHFFLAFTGIFMILTAIIIQTTRAGMYSSTDSNLNSRKEDQAALIFMATNSFTNSASNPATPSDLNDSNNNAVSNHPLHNAGFYVVLYDETGTVINSDTDPMASSVKSDNLKVNHSFIDAIGSTQLDGQSFRTLIVKPTSQYVVNGIKVAYIQIFQNVNQVQDSLSRITFEVTITMIAFWTLSLFVSIYLSLVSQRPLEVALDRQKAFVSNASHELRTPLAIMQNRLQLLFQHPNATILDESENISASLNEVRNMRVLTSNLLNMAKSEGSVQIQAVETDDKFFREVFENFEILAEDRGKAFTNNITFDGTVQLDQDLIKQVLTILFDNAAKYTDGNGQIHAEIFRQKNELQLSMSDNGPGISNADKKKIFDRFYRVDEARTRGKGGLGLGLALANEIVRAMKGKITVEDNKPQGTKFIVKLKV